MKHNKEYCFTVLEKVLLDLQKQRGVEYYDHDIPFEARFEKKVKNLYDGSIIENCWIVYATVPKDGWRGGKIMIDVDDDTGLAMTFVNTALGGRPITLPLALDDEGKYHIPISLHFV